MKTLISLALVSSLVSVATPQATAPEKLKGKQMPAFSMTTFEGKKITSASLKGKAYVLDFWATWCGPCKAASPSLNTLQGKYKSKGLVVIGVNMGETPKTMKLALKYPKEHKYTYTFTKNNDAFADKIGVGNIPLFIFVSKTGKVVAVETGFGPKSPEIFEKHVKASL